MSLQAPENVKLMACLCEERDTLRQCVELLERERQLLMDGDVDELADLTRRKASALEAAARNSANRERYLASRNLPVDNAGMSVLLEDQPVLRGAWNDILRRAQEARELNRVNGCLMETRVDRNRRALAVMHQAANSPAIYGNDGHLRHAIPVRALGMG